MSTSGVKTRVALIALSATPLAGRAPADQPFGLPRQAGAVRTPDARGRSLEGVREVAGAQVRLRIGSPDFVVAPGTRATLVIEVTAADGVRLYAPGQRGYRPLRLTLIESEAYLVHPAVFPPSKPHHLAPIDETVQVFAGRFRISQDVTVGSTPELRRWAADGESLTVLGTLEYQACDDVTCYRPETLPVSWTLTLAPPMRPSARTGR